MRSRSLFGYLIAITIAAIPVAVSALGSINWTFYAPGAGGQIQGSMQAAYPDPNGGTIIHTLDDVRTGKSPYVTLASATTMRGRWFCIGTVTYTSPMDNMTHTLENVVGYVHDTGCAFNGTCSCGLVGAYCNGVSHPEKMDIPVSNFTGWGGGAAMTFVTRNRNAAPSAWQQIAGLPQQSSGQNPVLASTGGSGSMSCGGVPQEMGTPVQAAYRPASIQDTGPGMVPYQVGGSPYTVGSPYGGNGMATNPYGMSGSPFSNVSPMPIGSPQQVGSPGSNTGYPSTGSIGTTGQPTPIGTIAGSSNGIGTPQGTGAVGQPSAAINQGGVQGPFVGQASALIIAQPTSVRVGQTISVAWTSVGMSQTALCNVNSDSGLFTPGNEGSQTVTAQQPGPFEFDLQCQTIGGSIVQKSVIVDVH